ncbi:hypothetical protein [Mycoplasmopsis gallopavonis]|uniref:Uncharacterized protein n=1 Tax=Mycoplasmopsis gallopavonis TaxID=76629 RepID=A0A449AYU6_9BACT|nr:hypothetical protein [Mycoplasmopsis gallopavonis]RIV16486.1 hypothetical protein D1113_02165 [Mycoplasmopsis gallopavonis]VEU72681.1 Uncharacterised protein [Mycoplasmopsis gallopavonis]
MVNLQQKSDSIAKLNRTMLIIIIISLSAFILGIILFIFGYLSIHTEVKSVPILIDGRYTQWRTPVTVFNSTLFLFGWIFLAISIILLISNLVIKIILVVKLNEFSRYNSKAQTSWILVLVSIFVIQNILGIISYFMIKNMLNESEIHPINQAN